MDYWFPEGWASKTTRVEQAPRDDARTEHLFAPSVERLNDPEARKVKVIEWGGGRANKPSITVRVLDDTRVVASGQCVTQEQAQLFISQFLFKHFLKA